ncbi:MAG: dihydroneopterin aldolase [Bacteroidetes bacterium]|nr:dihydroneopterin aldolase [Bacteroidota bacterium]
MHNIINIEGIRLYGYHGCLEEEGKIGGEYIIDVSMTVNFMEAAVSDDLSQTIDYCDIFNIAREEMAVRSKLIEHVGKRIYDRIQKGFPQLEHCTVKVTKLLPPMNGPVDRVSIVIGD